VSQEGGEGSNQSRFVIDASAVLAVLFEEEGAGAVLPHLPSGSVSAVNLSEVATVAVRRGAKLSEVREFLSRLPLSVVPFDTDHAYRAAGLEPHAKAFNLSLGDRACLATGLVLGEPVLTAERRWVGLPLPIAIRLIR